MGTGYGHKVPLCCFEQEGRRRIFIRMVLFFKRWNCVRRDVGVPVPMVYEGAKMKVNMGTREKRQNDKGVYEDARSDRKASSGPGGPVDNR